MAASDRNSGWISWLWPKPISDTMSRKRRGGAQSLQSSSLLYFLAKHIRRQEGADAFFADGGADHAECIARSATVPGATDFGVGLQIVVELGPAAPEKVGSAGQIGQRGAAFEPVGGESAR